MKHILCVLGMGHLLGMVKLLVCLSRFFLTVRNEFLVASAFGFETLLVFLQTFSLGANVLRLSLMFP